MSRLIKLGSIYPADLNLNGDQANLLVLQKRLKLRGVSCEVVEVTIEQLNEVDLVLVGHGSVAAWKFILQTHPSLMNSLAEQVRAGFPVFAVSSGAIELLKALGERFESGEHRSEFVTEGKLVGYLNSSVKAPLIQKINTSWFTMLHGPVLAKNPEFADEICIELGWLKSESLGKETEQLDELAAISRKIAFEH